MTPKEKTEELIRKYYTWGINKEGQTLSWLEAKQCVSIAIEEILNGFYSLRFTNVLDDDLEYWEEVKQEIKNK
jgi:hypothetical protein